MKKEYVLITNNPLVKKDYEDTIDLEFSETFDYKDVLEIVRDKIHSGYILETHPLSGSIKPNETPYKSVIVSKPVKDSTDTQSLLIIEDAIATYDKFKKNRPTPNWKSFILDDFQIIDHSLIKNVIGKLQGRF